MMKNFLMAEIFLKKLAICSQFHPHESMRKKCFLLACCLCTGALAVPSVFGGEPTYEELWKIAKEAYAKNLWEPEVKDPNATEGLRYLMHPDRDINAWWYLSRDILYYSEVGNTSKIFRQQLSNFKDLIKKCEKDVLPEWNMEEWDFGTEAILHNTIKNARKTESIHKIFATSNLDQLVPFIMEKMQPFIEKRDLEFLKAIDAFAKELRVFYDCLRGIQSEMTKAKIPPENVEKLSKTFMERQGALLQVFRAPMSDKNSLETYFKADFLDTVKACAFVKKFNTLRRETAFEAFKPKNLTKTETEKAKVNFNILGLDMNLVKYPNPFKKPKRKEDVGKLLQEKVNYFVEETYSAYERIGEAAETNFILALELLHPLTQEAWTCECFDPVPVMQTFKEALLECDIEMLINKYTPKPNANALHKGFELLQKEKKIDTSAVEKTIYDTYVACLEDGVKTRFYAVVTNLWELMNHRISFIKTVRKMEENDPEDPEKAFENAQKQVTEWRQKCEEYRQKFSVAEGNFYRTFFGGKKKDWQGNYIKTFGGVNQPECLDILRERLKDYGLWEQPQTKKKEEVPQKPNDEEQSTVVEDKKEPENTIIDSGYTKLTNESEFTKPQRVRRSKSNSKK